MYVGGMLKVGSPIKKKNSLLGNVSALPLLPAIQSALKGRLPVGPEQLSIGTEKKAGATKKPGSAIGAVGIVILGLMATGVASVPVLYYYGSAREAKSKLVKTTGYIMAGLGAFGAIGTLIGTVALAAGVASGEITQAGEAAKPESIPAASAAAA